MLLKHKSKRGGHFHVSYFDTGCTAERRLMQDKSASRTNVTTRPSGAPVASIGSPTASAPARHLDDSTMRSVVPIQTPHGVLLKRCAPPDENHSLFASSNNMEMRLREGAKMHWP